MSSKRERNPPSVRADARSETSSTSDSLRILDRYLEGCLDRVTESGPVADPACFRQWLPTGLAIDHQALLLYEMIKLDMSMAADSGRLRSVEAYVDALNPPLSRQSVPIDVVIEEQQLRRSLGRDEDQPISERFPHLVGLDIARDQAALAAGTASTEEIIETLEAGDRLDDFLILSRLGKGSFASVFLARQETMQRLVALKVSSGVGDEPRTLARLDHPNIVRIFDQRSDVHVPEHPQHRLDLLYMQYVPGGSLADVVTYVRVQRELDLSNSLSGQALLDCVDERLWKAAQQVPEASEHRHWIASLTWCETVAWIGIQLAQALDHAHGCGILHQDVKPANVLISAEGIPKLADFNVSSSRSDESSKGRANLGGSLAYMSPEHLRAISPNDPISTETLDHRSDFYSLSVLLWELWQGRRPFQFSDHADSPTEVIQRQLESRTSEFRPAERRNDVGDHVLESILRRGMSVDPSKRFESGRQFSGHLQIALNPELAELFDPPKESWRHWLFARSAYLLAAIIILLPNIVAGVFNFQYNHQQIIETHKADVPTLENTFHRLALVVNSVAFPAGIGLLVWYTKPIFRALRCAKSGTSPRAQDVDATLLLGMRAAAIGGLIWVVAGIVYPTTLRFITPVLDNTEAIHFFMSLLICGGVAAVYPFFGMTLLASSVYYPRIQRDFLQDDQFLLRDSFVRRWCRRMLFAATLIPLLGLMLLLSRDVTAKGTMAIAVLASVAGLFAAFSAYERIDRDWRKMAKVFRGRDPERKFF